MNRVQEQVNAIDWTKFLNEALIGQVEIITHGHCPDGIASALIMQEALKIHSKCDIIGQQPIVTHALYNDKHLQQPRQAVFVDFSPPAELAAKWRDAGAIVLDHHIKAEETILSFASINQGAFAHETEDPGISGALLAH